MTSKPIKDNDDTSHYEGALLEVMDHKLDLLTESLADVPRDIQNLKSDVSQLKEDMAVVKHAVKTYSGELDNHEHRIRHLEKHTA